MQHVRGWVGGRVGVPETDSLLAMLVTLSCFATGSASFQGGRQMRLCKGLGKAHGYVLQGRLAR